MDWILTEDGGHAIATEAGAIITTESPPPAGPVQPLQTISLPAYPYVQYRDDPNVVAFFTAYNELAQSYLDWFNQTPLGIWTSPNVSGQLLDFVLGGLYGIARPVFSTLQTTFQAGLNAFAVNDNEVDGVLFSSSGTSVIANDDFYKRFATWWLYVGDGRHFTIPVLRKKVARWLYGVNGTDVPLSLAQNVGITVSGLAFTITVPTSTAGTFLQQAFQNGILSFPFVYSVSVVLT